MNKKQILAAAMYVIVAMAAGTVKAQASKQISFHSGLNLIETAIARFDPDFAINTKLMRNFRKDFPKAKDATWYTLKDGYVATFDDGGMKHMAGYDLSGKWQYSIISYGVKNLPESVRSRVRSVYYDYTISFVQEITVHGQTIFLVHIEDEHTLKTVRVMEDGMDTIEEFNKSI